MITQVVFRVYRGTKTVLALFPNEPYNDDPNLCMSYERVGQHGAAHYSHCVHNLTYAATAEEYAPLKRELESIGYVLDVRKRKSVK
jgi:hypothetical protein